MPTTQYTKRYGIYRANIYEDVLPILKFISMNIQPQLKFPTMKVLKAIAKKLLLNVHEALYLVSNLKQDWTHQNQFFNENSKEIRDIIFERRPEEGYKSTLLFLLLRTASIKMSLNDNFRIYTAQLESTLPNFRPILSTFMQNNPLQDPSLKQLNQLYKCILREQSSADYEDIVDNIMHICPTYRLGGETQQMSSCTNTFGNKKQASYKKTTTSSKQLNSVFINNKFQLLSQRSQLQRPIMQQDESRRVTQFFKFQSQQYNNYINFS